MSNFVKVGKAFVNLDLAHYIFLEEGPVKRHYADEPEYGSIIFKPGETTYIRDEESLKRVKAALGFTESLVDDEVEFIGDPHKELILRGW